MDEAHHVRKAEAESADSATWLRDAGASAISECDGYHSY
jgi:hypothetical protein